MKNLITIAFISFLLFAFQPLIADDNEEEKCETRQGTVKWFNTSRGYGFIAQEQGDDLFVHHKDIKADGFIALKSGQKVEYCIFDGPNGIQAVNVKVIKDSNLVCKNNIQRTKGMVKMFDASNGFGFISQLDTTEVLMLFVNTLTEEFNIPKKGDIVTFCVLQIPQGKFAIKVKKENP